MMLLNLSLLKNPGAITMMKENASNLIVSSLLFFNFVILAIDSDIKNSDSIMAPTKNNAICVSLGGGCILATEFKRYGLRNAAYPFDIITSELVEVIKIIENNFKFFTDKNYLKRRINYKNQYWTYHTLYDLNFPHDFDASDNPKDPFEDRNFTKFEEHYNRRIARFNNLSNCTQQVFFFRYQSIYNKIKYTIDDIIKLKEIIKKKFPLLNFKIINIVTCDSTEKITLIDENIISFSTKRSLAIHASDTINYFRNIFTTVGLEIQEPNKTFKSSYFEE